IEPRAALLAELLRTGGYDLLYMNNQPASNQEGYVAAVQAGLPVVQHCRTEPKLSTQEVALVNRAASRVICVSSGVRDKLVARGVDAARLSVVYNAIDGRAELPAAATAPAGDGLVIGSVGQLVARKATGDLLRALAILHGERRPLRCVILGEGPQRAELEELARSLGIAAQVHFMGFQAQPLAFIQSMDLFVICSPSEGLPRVVLEAMLAQKPVIGSDVTGTRELVLPEQNGLLYPYGDVPALSAALRRLMDDAALRRRMGAAGRARVLAEFSMQGYVDGISEVLTGALR
ncbi:MAG: glycosyltransferase, partial [Rhodocyclaceae bacterium]|nr:glycosyltransferase [Rhodocyclaceae bacterium]